MKIFGKHLIEQKALNQFYEVVRNTDDIIDWALMPDAHLGQVVPIGSVILAEKIHPEWIGVDIGCGMTSCCFDCEPFDIDWLYDKIFKVVPVGFNHREKPIGFKETHYKIENADNQLGTLGGGNHFIEIGKDHNNWFWITVHSGSRGVGFKTAQKLLKEKEILSDKEIFDIIKNIEHWAYINRRLIIQEVLSLLNFVEPVDIIESIHNNVVRYKNGWLHRKGATNAELNKLGLIPASMGKGVFIVKGKGSSESLDSCSHGAGRVSSRKEAKEKCDMNAFAQQMKGIKCKLIADENPKAYKDIGEVLKAQNELVEIVTQIKPILNVKG